MIRGSGLRLCIRAVHCCSCCFWRGLQVDLVLDAVLGPLAGTITRQIRLRAVRQYLQPYSSVDIATMAAAFNRP